ncbi:hypothetical protein [Azonexus fungiphilus]|uniref:hypothetical protein n=1 Tax=Azonexus fungiphilus TaxID=146940 RepID=UPI00156BC6AE|nr:hypothetical protein [Azonexus fungiphilus]NHC07583.1 hypothetical protein [Azonexus fungiphilus]
MQLLLKCLWNFRFALFYAVIIFRFGGALPLRPGLAQNGGGGNEKAQPKGWAF